MSAASPAERPAKAPGSPAGRAALRPRAVQHASRVTNGSSTLPGVDGRSSVASIFQRGGARYRPPPILMLPGSPPGRVPFGQVKAATESKLSRACHGIGDVVVAVRRVTDAIFARAADLTLQ